MPQPPSTLPHDLISTEQFTEILNFAGNHRQKLIDSYGIYLLRTLDDFHINTKKRVAGFLSQVCAESFGLLKDPPIERGYTKGKYRPIGTKMPLEEVHTPDNKDDKYFDIHYKSLYINKKTGLPANSHTPKSLITLNNSLGNDKLHDGSRYRGRGPIQITGHAMYHRIQGLIGQRIGGKNIEKDPDLVANDKTVGLIVAAAVFESKGCNEVADQVDPDKEESIHETNRQLTRLINGHANGLDIRLKYYVKALEVLVGHVTPSIYDHMDIRDPLEFLSRSTFLDTAEMSFLDSERKKRQKSSSNKIPKDVQERISANIAAYKKAHPEHKSP